MIYQIGHFFVFNSRRCGGGFCEDCSTHQIPVPERGWGDAPVRVCDPCYDKGIEKIL